MHTIEIYAFFDHETKSWDLAGLRLYRDQHIPKRKLRYRMLHAIVRKLAL